MTAGERSGMEKAKNIALLRFSRIGYGKDKALRRPANKSVDRQLRKLISKWNMDGNHDTIINTGDGYYIPRKDNPAEMLEYKQYIAQETARAYIELDKVKPMWVAYERMEKNGGKQQNEGSSGGEGGCPDSEQLRLQL